MNSSTARVIGVLIVFRSPPNLTNLLEVGASGDLVGRDACIRVERQISERSCGS